MWVLLSCPAKLLADELDSMTACAIFLVGVIVQTCVLSINFHSHHTDLLLQRSREHHRYDHWAKYVRCRAYC